MKNLLPGLLLLVLGACVSTPEEDATASGEVLALLGAQSAAWNRGDIDGFMQAGYWRSPELTFYSQGSITKGYDATLARYKKNYTTGGAEMGQLEFSRIETKTLADDVQLARGHWQLAYRDKPGAGGLFSLVLKRLPEGWRIVHDHTSVDAEAK